MIARYFRKSFNLRKVQGKSPEKCNSKHASRGWGGVTAIGFRLNWNRGALQESLFIQYVKTEKYNNNRLYTILYNKIEAISYRSLNIQ